MDTYFPRTILLVENAAVVALVEASILKDLGYRTRLAFTGQKAVALATCDPNVDLVLMDANLGDGLDSLLAARAILRQRPIPIIFLTNHDNRDPACAEWLPSLVRYLPRDSSVSALQSMIHSVAEQL